MQQVSVRMFFFLFNKTEICVENALKSQKLQSKRN